MTFSDPGQFDAAPANFGQPIDLRPAFGDAEEFPLAALPPRVAAAVHAIVDIVQIPVPIAASSILAACSLVAQARVMVEMPTREIVPASMIFTTIAASGERKTSADKLALKAVNEFERDLRRSYGPAMQTYSLNKLAYDASLASAKNGRKSRDEREDALRECGEPPIPPAVPALLVEDFTIEGLTKLLDEGYPFTGIFSDDAARIVGGYSMQEGRQASTGAALSQLWDGKPIKRVRSSDVAKILDNRRVSVHMMLQPGVAMKFFGDRELRDQGLMSRILVCFPRSMKGERLWREAKEESWEAIEAYHTRLTKLIQQVFSKINPETRDLDLKVATLTPEARALWIGFSDAMEKQQGAGGALADVSDIASKMAQHALRLAAVLSHFENGEGIFRDGISAQSMAAGIQLAQFYLAEAQRIFNAGSVSADSENAQTLIDFIRKEGLRAVGLRWLSRNGPKHVRAAELLRRAILLLTENRHLIELKGGGTFEARGKSLSERTVYSVIYEEGEAP